MSSGNSRGLMLLRETSEISVDFYVVAAGCLLCNSKRTSSVWRTTVFE